MPFNKNFLWGASTSAYQYEGATSVDGKGPSVQDMMAAPDGKSDFNVASDGYHRIEEDVRLFQEAGFKSYRFSIAWSRLYPEGTGELNQAGLDWYLHLLDLLEAAHIEPVVTLYHFDLPAALQEKGGWADRATIDAFMTYVQTVFEVFGTRVTYYQTVNEQNMLFLMTINQAMKGDGDFQAVLQGNHNLFVAGAKAISYAHSHYPHIKIGPAPNLVAVYPLTPKPEDAMAAATYDAVRNLLFSDMAVFGRYNQTALTLFRSLGLHIDITPEDEAALAVAKPDILYFNFYNSETVEAGTGGPLPLPFNKVPNPTVPQTEFGWDIDPLGFRLTLRQLWDRYHVPLMITENGLGAHDTVVDGAVHDAYRIDYLKDHVRQMREAVDEGIDVVGYHIWSAVDLVSTHEGFEKRYGLIYVDRDEHNEGSMDRLKKDSFTWFKELIETNGEQL